MDKNAIKKYAVWARQELISRVSQKAYQYGITENDIVDANADSIDGKLLTDSEKKERQALIAQVKEKGFEQVMEEVAYTWFNRFSALRFMEVNGYLPSHVRVFTDDENNFKPQIIAEAIHLELDGLDMDKVYACIEADDKDALYKYLLITQCNALNKILPGVFQKIADYTELLFPDNLLREGSVVEQMIAQIPEKDFDINSGGQVEIIGWLYQYYNDERKNEVISIYKGTVKKEDIPAATQLFTTDWVVRYIVDNSLGRYWIERNPDSKLKDELQYYVTPKNGVTAHADEKVIPEELTVFDPCMGSGHFLVYAFDVLMKIYTEYGYSEREAAQAIVEKNLYGLDIDNRASQLAYFAVMMKARQYDHRFLNYGIKPHVYAIGESNHLDTYVLEYFVNGNIQLKADMQKLVDDMNDAKEYGSIIHISPVDFDALFARFDEIQNDINMYKESALNELLPIVQVAYVMSQKYAVVVTNPPYLNKMDAKLKKYVTDNYKDYSGDLFSVFMYRNFDYCKVDGYSGFMTPFVWMFIKTYEKLREYIIENKSITTLVQMEYSAFEEATVPICSFVLKNGRETSKGLYFRLSEFKGGMEVQKQKVLEVLENKSSRYFFETSQTNFCKVPASTIAYWITPELLQDFEKGDLLGNIAKPRQGMATTNNDLFLRLWFEVSAEKMYCHAHDKNEALQSKKKWFPYNKGGDFRKWYGNNDYLVNWENDGQDIKKYLIGKNPNIPRGETLYFNKCFSWSLISSSSPAFRFKDYGNIFDIAGMSCFSDEYLLYLLALCNSKVTLEILSILAPTINFQAGDIANIPVLFDKMYFDEVEALVKDSILISKNDWDAFEISWDFSKHPIMHSYHRVAEAYITWESECKSRYDQLKANEEELNHIFIDIYGLQDELSPSVEDKNVTVRKADLQRDIKGLISYAVGCMFGRYSLDIEGLAYAGGDWDATKYKTYPVDEDNIIPICDDEYFPDDIVGRFVKFIETAYGKETLEENLKFIADALGGKGTPRNVIRSYFLNDFYADHCKMYKKRPIYWLFDSGKKNGFKALIYMHRYQPDTIARMRTDYVHEQQERYRTAITHLEERINKASTSERVKLNKQLSKLQDQAAEIKVYEEKIHHLADQMIPIDLDDGVKHNYEIFKDVLAKIK